MRNKLLILGLLICFFSTPLQAETDEKTETITPTKIIEVKGKEIHKLVLNAKSDDEMREQVRTVLESFVDFREFGRLCLGSQWEKLTEEQQKTYLGEFKILLQNSYLRRFDAGSDFEMTLRKKARKNKTGDRIQVHTTIAGKSDDEMEADVDYRFYQTKDGWKVYDILIDEVSMMRNYRRSFIKIYKKDGFDELIRRMKNKSEDKESKGDDI